MDETVMQVTEQTADWITYFVRVPKHYGQDKMKEFNAELMRKLPAMITQDCSRGYDLAKYTPDKDGLYEVRLMQNKTMARAFISAIFQMYYATVIRMELYPPGSNEPTVVTVE